MRKDSPIAVRHYYLLQAFNKVGVENIARELKLSTKTVDTWAAACLIPAKHWDAFRRIIGEELFKDLII